jgi:hypothetical protein
MSDETYSLVAILSALAAAGALWSMARRGQLMRRLRRSLDAEQLRRLDADARENTPATPPIPPS